MDQSLEPVLITRLGCDPSGNNGRQNLQRTDATTQLPQQQDFFNEGQTNAPARLGNRQPEPTELGHLAPEPVVWARSLSVPCAQALNRQDIVQKGGCRIDDLLLR